MKSKFWFILVSILCLFSMLSVGFASWVVTKPFDDVLLEDKIDTIVYEAYDNAKYIDILDSTVLEYYRTGFVENNTIITKTGKMTINFKFKVKDFKDYLSEKNLSFDNISINLILKHATNSNGIDFFANSAPYEITYVVNGLTASEITGTGSDAQINLTTLPNADEIQFSVTYKITYKGTNFKTDVFDKINGVRFAVEAKVTKE